MGLDKRDYQFLAANRNDITMESMMYGTSKTSYQNIGGARLAIKHSSPVNPERRTQHVNSIYIESAEGERFKYPSAIKCRIYSWYLLCKALKCPSEILIFSLKKTKYP